MCFALFCLLAPTAHDDPPVIIGCPDDKQVTAAAGANSAFVSWTEPTASDNSGITPTVTRTHVPNSRFFLGTTLVTYTFTDRSDNTAVCSFEVTISRKIINCTKNFVFLKI